GTRFEPPLRKSLEILEKSEFKKADIVFITDGDSHVSDEFMEEFHQKKSEKRFSVHSVLINMSGGGSTRTVSRFSDRIINVSNLADLEGQNSGAIDIFGGMS